ncbi:MAG: enoyl-CoA hydratase [Burkholderiales bacterium]|nr:MAG: enoyl-CoA hydratase [Burkholderiales bacterium]
MNEHNCTESAAAVLLTRPAPHVALVTINRPQFRNAVNRAVAVQLAHHMRAIEGDADVHVAILTGAGDLAFCAGVDLKEVADGSPLGERSTGSGGFAGFVFAPREKVWIAAINGAAVAGGLELMLACDFAIASDRAVFGLPEVKRGLCATSGGVFRLPRAIPRGVALEMIATGDILAAQRALDLGLVNRLVPPDELLSAAIEVAKRIARNAPLSVRLSLQLARVALDEEESTLRQRAQSISQQIMASEDAKEGPRAFAEHREPRWIGR